MPRTALSLILPVVVCACSSTSTGVRAPSSRAAFDAPQNPGSYAGQPVLLNTGPDYGSAIPRNSGILNASVGARQLEDSRWAPLDDQFGGSLDYTFKGRDSWLGLNVGLSGGGQRETFAGVTVDAWQAELSIGPRVYVAIPQTPVYFYGGVSAALCYGEFEVDLSPRASDTFFAGIASAGVMFQLNRVQAIGLEYRTLQGADISRVTPGAPDDANNSQIAITFSAAF